MALPEGPQSRAEQYLAKIAGQAASLPEAPRSRVEQYLDYIAENGTVSKEEIAEQVSEKVSDWLEENIHEDPTVVIDSSLSVSGAAADAKVAGDKLNELTRIAVDYTTYDILQINMPFFHGYSRTTSGITFTWNNDYTAITLTGASTSTSSNFNIFYSKTALPEGMVAGGLYYIKAEFPSSVKVVVTAYIDGSDTEIYRYSNNHELLIPEDANGLLIQIRAFRGYTFNDTYQAPRILSDANDSYIEDYCSISMFPRIGVIGDSFASGSLHTPTAYVTTNYTISWPQILARHYGVNVTNFSVGGLTTKTFLTNSDRGLPVLLNSPKQHLYVIALGINDANRINDGSYTLGTVADITSDYTQNPDTFYGNYGRIIGSILNYAPNAKIVLLSVARIAQRFLDGDIKNVAEACNVAFVDLTQDRFFVSKVYDFNLFDGHPNAFGYSGMATAISRLLKRCIVENSEYFADYYGLPVED